VFSCITSACVSGLHDKSNVMWGRLSSGAWRPSWFDERHWPAVVNVCARVWRMRPPSQSQVEQYVDDYCCPSFKGPFAKISSSSSPGSTSHLAQVLPCPFPPPLTLSPRYGFQVAFNCRPLHPGKIRLQFKATAIQDTQFNARAIQHTHTANTRKHQSRVWYGDALMDPTPQPLTVNPLYKAMNGIEHTDTETHTHIMLVRSTLAPPNARTH